jgi:hypothetical protein
MTLIVDGVAIDAVKIDGVEMDEVHIDGVVVYESTKVDLSGIPSLVDDFQPQPNNAFVEYAIYNNETHDTTEFTTVTVVDPNWLVKGVAGDYHVKMVINSGAALDGSSVDVWLPMTSSYNWSLTQSSNGSKSSNVTVSLSDDAGATTLESRTFILQAIKEP